MTHYFLFAIWLAMTMVSITSQHCPAQYDPLQVVAKGVDSVTLEVHDADRGRDIPLRVYLPATQTPAPVVVFSHGLGGSRDNNSYLGQHLSGRGYVAVFLQHPGSDEQVWRDVGLGRRMSAMRSAASFDNLVARCQDVRATLNQLEIVNGQASSRLVNRLDLEHIGMCGHSFGAHTTQYVSGQVIPLQTQISVDPRIDAAIAYSPSSPWIGSERVFRNVSVPWLLMTGTRDVSPIGGQTVESRIKVYPSLPDSIDKYLVVLHNAEHSAFSERALPGDNVKRNPNHHRIILAFSTAFWDSYLRDDPAAKAWLTSEAANKLLEKDDQWKWHLKD